MELAANAWLRISQGGLRALSGTVCLLALLAPSQGRAQEVAARAYLTPASVVLNGQFVLNIEIRGVQRADVDPELPLIGSFGRYLGASSSTNMQVINGATTVSLIVQYRYQAMEEGKQVKKLLADLHAENPKVKGNVLAALRNIRPTHLLDRGICRLDESASRIDARRSPPIIPDEDQPAFS